MKALIKKINSKNSKKDSDSPDLIEYNNKKHNIFLRLAAILINEKKKEYYKTIVFRLFRYLVVYLEKIKSSSIKIISRAGKKFYYINKLYLKDAENFFLNTNIKDSTKYYYLNIIKKYIMILNKNTHIKFSDSIQSIKVNSNNNHTLNSNIRTLIQKIKNEDNPELLCCFYSIFFLGLSFYQISKLTYKNYNSKSKTLVFISYKYKRQILKKKKISKQMELYFDKFFNNKNEREGFLFFNNLRDKKGDTRKSQIEKVFKNLFIKKLKLTKIEVKNYIDELNEERTARRIYGSFRYIFESFVNIIDDSNIFI